MKKVLTLGQNILEFFQKYTMLSISLKSSYVEVRKFFFTKQYPTIIFQGHTHSNLIVESDFLFKLRNTEILQNFSSVLKIKCSSINYK